MKKIGLLIMAFLSLYSGVAQYNFIKQWDKRFGGFGNEQLFSFQQTKDGGYILGGLSTSNIGGDKTQLNWDSSPETFNPDYWVVKIDSFGNKQWDKRFGGVDDDGLHALCQTYDQGYLLGGFSGSDNDGDKSQPGRGGGDYWVVKIDSLGNKQWDRRFGGADVDNLWCLGQASDSGYILGGYSQSGIGGDKTAGNWGGGDDF
jgi:hypothetical protein